MKNIYTIILLFLSLFASEILLAQSFYAVQPPDGGNANLYTIDASTGTVTDSLVITIGATSINGFTAMARNPVDNQIFIIARSGINSKLATLAEDGTATFIADLSDKFAGITFDAAGNMYGITGDGSTVPSTVYSINKSTGATTFELAPPDGSDGEAIAFNTNNGLLYRYAGGTVFQSINLLTNMTTFIDSIDLTNNSNYAHALYFDPVSGNFTFGAADTLYSLTTTGVLTTLSTHSLTSGIKGLVLKSCASANVTVSQSNSTLTADSAADSYQWIDCDNSNMPITNATGQSFTATANGNYAVVATTDACSDTSSCVNVNGVGIEVHNPSLLVAVHPNPTSKTLMIELDRTQHGLSLEMFDITGQLKATIDPGTIGVVEFSMIDFAPGVYLLKIKAGDQSTVSRIIKN